MMKAWAPLFLGFKPGLSRIRSVVPDFTRVRSWKTAQPRFREPGSSEIRIIGYRRAESVNNKISVFFQHNEKKMSNTGAKIVEMAHGEVVLVDTWTGTVSTDYYAYPHPSGKSFIGGFRSPSSALSW